MFFRKDINRWELRIELLQGYHSKWVVARNVVFSGQGHEGTAVGRFVAVRWGERKSGRRSCSGHASILQDGASRGFHKEVFLRGEEGRRVFVPIFFFFPETRCPLPEKRDSQTLAFA